MILGRTTLQRCEALPSPAELGNNLQRLRLWRQGQRGKFRRSAVPPKCAVRSFAAVTSFPVGCIFFGTFRRPEIPGTQFAPPEENYQNNDKAQNRQPHYNEHKRQRSGPSTEKTPINFASNAWWFTHRSKNITSKHQHTNYRKGDGEKQSTDS